MQALSSSNLVRAIEENVPALANADETAPMRLRLLAGQDYLYAGYYEKDPTEGTITVSVLTGHMADFHFENLNEVVTDSSPDMYLSGWFFVLKGESRNKYNYCHYYVAD